MKKIIILSAAFLGLNMAANAQTPVNATANASQNVALALTNAISINFIGGTGGTVTLPFTTVANYQNGVTSSTDQILKVQSNKNFNVTVNANADNFSYTGSETSGTTMPVSGVLAVEVTGNTTAGTIQSSFTGGYGNLTHSAQDLIDGCSKGGDQEFTVSYKATPGFTYPSGTYTVGVVYTATQY